MFLWCLPSNLTATHTPIALGNNGANGCYVMHLDGAAGGDPVELIKQSDAGSAGIAASTASYSASSWNASGAAFRSDTSRDAYLGGANKGSNTTNVADPTPDFLSLGVLLRSTAASYLTGSLAETFIFNYAPTDAEHALLGKGIHPIDAGILLSNIKGWYPLLAEDNNHMTGGYPNLSATGSPTFGSHPFQPIYPRIGALIGL